MEKYSIDKKEIIKSNSLIESSYRLTAVEQKIIYYGSSMLSKRMLENDLSITDVEDRIQGSRFPLLKINACDFMKAFKMNTGNVYKMLEEASIKLMDRKLIYIYDDGKPVVRQWIITCKYDEENARIELQFHPDLIRDLLIFKDKYTILKLKDTTDIKSGYAYRLYELVKQYEKFKFRVFSLEDLKFKLGIEDDEYEKYSSFKQNVINPSMKSINKTTDLEISIEEIKDKRKVVKIKFIIRNKGKQSAENMKQLNFLETEDNNSDIVFHLQKMLNFNVTAGQAQKIINESFEATKKYKLQINVIDYIKQKKKIIDEYAKKNKIESYLGLIIRAIQNNWTSIFIDNIRVDRFNDFEQRAYDCKEIDELENKLTAWNK